MLKTALNATIAGIAGLITFQKLPAIVRHSLEQSPDRPRRSSDELSALEAINERLQQLESSLGLDLNQISMLLKNSDKETKSQLIELGRLVSE